MNIKELFSNPHIGFDMGTSKFRIFKDGKLALEMPTEYEYKGRIIKALMVNGKIADFTATELLIKRGMHKIHKPIWGLTPSIQALVAVPSDMNEVGLRAFQECMEHTGARSVLLLNDCFIAATGLDIDITSSTAMIVDCGAGKTSITTIQGYKIIKNTLFDISGNSLDLAIQTYLSNHYGLLLSLQEAEQLKIDYADLSNHNIADKLINIKGKDKKTNELKTISIQIGEISHCLNSEITLLIDRVLRHFESLEDTYTEKIKMNGVYLIGGGFKLKGLIDLIAAKINVANKSYYLNTDYMKVGFEKVNTYPKTLCEKMSTDAQRTAYLDA